MKFTFFLLIVACKINSVEAKNFDVGFSGAIDLETTGYKSAPLYEGQKRNSANLSISPKWGLTWNIKDHIDAEITLAPFFNVHPYDSARTYSDLREAKFKYDLGKTNYTVGYDHVFWGKTESDQLVDIINQTDMLAGTDDKLGQPLLSFSHFSDIGAASLATSIYYLPLFRERSFAGVESRNRSSITIDSDHPIYLDDTSEKTPSYAARVDSTIGSVDLGLSFFDGLSRDPGFSLNSDGSALQPVYGEITQVGIDGQITLDSSLLKFEAIKRNGQINRLGVEENYSSAILGIEHTLYQLRGSNADLGLIFEYAKDSRNERSLTPLENDIILGARLAVNNASDTSALLTTSIDINTNETYIRLEGQHRLNDHLSISTEAGVLTNADPNSLLYDQRNDSFLSLDISYSW